MALDAQSGALLLSCDGHTEGVTSVAFSPEGGRLITGAGHAIKVWELASRTMNPVGTMHLLPGKARVTLTAAGFADGNPEGLQFLRYRDSWALYSGESSRRLRQHRKTQSCWNAAFRPSSRSQP